MVLLVLVRFFARVLDAIEDLCAALAGLCIVYLLLVICTDVVSRSMFRAPLGPSIEYTRYALMLIPFLAMAWLVRLNGHVRIDIVLNAVPERVRNGLLLVATALSALTCALAALFAYNSALSQHARGVMTIGIFPIPQYWLMAAISFCLALTAIELLRVGLGRLRQRGAGDRA